MPLAVLVEAAPEQGAPVLIPAWARHLPCATKDLPPAEQVHGGWALLDVKPTGKPGAVYLERDARRDVTYAWCACGCCVAPLLLIRWQEEQDKKLERAMRRAREHPEDKP